MIFSFFRILLLIQHLILKAVELHVYLFIYQFFNLNSDLEFMKESHPESLWRLPNRIPIVPGQSSVPLEEKPWKRYLRSIYASLQKEITGILISQGCVYFIEFLCKGRRNYLLFWIVLFTMYHGLWGIQFKFDIGIYVYVKTRLCMTYF